MEIFKLLGTIAIEGVADAKKDITQTADNANSASSKIQNAFKKIGTAVVSFLAADKIKDFGLACINAASDAQAMESQFSQVFGDFEGQASKSLSKIAKDSGIVENRMKSSFTKIAAFAKTTGMDTADSLELADRAMVAVADSAAFYDRTLEETTESLQSFLKGNYENDAALGLSCTETTRNAAANKLYGKSFNDLSEAQKQLTLLQMVEDANALSGALGQAARESDTWSNQTGNLKQAWADFTAMIGEKFLPLVIKIVSKLSELLQWMTEHETAIGIIATVVGTLTTAIVTYTIAQNAATAGMTLATAATTAFGSVMAFVTSPITLVVAAIGALIAIGVLLAKNWDTIAEKASEIFSKVKTIFEKFATVVSDVWNGIWKTIKGVINSIIGGVESWINGIISSINFLISGINKLVSGAGKLLGINFSIGEIGRAKLPRLEQGGILKKGQVGLLEGTGAEAVVPLDQNRRWISAVAAEMNFASGGNDISKKLDMLIEMLRPYLSSMLNASEKAVVTPNGKEIARLLAPYMGAQLQLTRW